MGRIAIVGYKPRSGKEGLLLSLMKEHVPILRGEGLATERKSIVMRARDGTIVEVFEWVSAEAIQAAHSNPRVLEMWKRYEEVCEYVPVGTLEEIGQLFSEFEPIEVETG